MWSCQPPSLATLEKRFPHQRRDLEAIVSMSDHDVQLTRNDPTWLMTRDHQYLAYSPETGITQERWDEYRRLFARNRLRARVSVAGTQSFPILRRTSQ